jgi:hypothetical protein
VALLRFASARHPDDEALQALIAGLRAGGDEFAAWWDSHDVAEKQHGIKRYVHPVVGDLALHYEALLLAGDGDQLLTIYAAEPGTRDAERLARITELAGTLA